MAKADRLSREYLLSDEFKRKMEEYVRRREAQLRAQEAREQRRRERLRRLTFGLLGR